MTDRWTDDSHAMTAHENDVFVSEHFSQRMAFLRIADQHIRDPKIFPDIEDRNAITHKRSHMVHWPHRYIRVGERNYRRRMSVNDGIHIGPHPIDFGVDESFRVQRTALRIDRDSVQVELQQIRRGNQLRSQRARHDKTIRVSVVPRADVSVSIDDALLRQDPVCCDEVFNKHRIRRPCGGGRRLPHRHA